MRLAILVPETIGVADGRAALSSTAPTSGTSPSGGRPGPISTVPPDFTTPGLDRDARRPFGTTPGRQPMPGHAEERDRLPVGSAYLPGPPLSCGPSPIATQGSGTGARFLSL